MPATIPALNAAWRTSPRNDRELIRSYALWPLSAYNLTQLTSVLNRIAEVSTVTVTQVQVWIDEVETLEQDWADKVADGTAHLGNVQSYEGPAPGVTLTRQDRQKKADVLEWDTSLLQVNYQAGTRGDSTAGGVLHARVADLKRKILQTLGIKPYDGDGGGDARLLRS
jgi:hypothetical protein